MQCHLNSSSSSSSIGWSVLNGSLRTGDDTTSPHIKGFIESSLGTEIAGGCKNFLHTRYLEKRKLAMGLKFIPVISIPEMSKSPSLLSELITSFNILFCIKRISIHAAVWLHWLIAAENYSIISNLCISKEITKILQCLELRC
jgi:hypothetical protein